jgi:hypothetical protein
MTENTTDMEAEARAEAEKRYPELDPTRDEATYPRSAVRYYENKAYQKGFLAGARRPFTDTEVEAAAHEMYCGREFELDEGGDDDDWAILHESWKDQWRGGARAALDAITKSRSKP